MYSTYTSLFVLAMLANTAFAQSTFQVNSGATLYLKDATLTLTDTKLTNNGTLEATSGSTVHIKGTATTVNSTIAGTGTTTIGNLTINKSSNDAQINQNISVSGNLTLTMGSLKLNAGNITFTGSGQIMGETNTNRIYGTGGELITTVTLNAPTDVNPANLGANITSSANLGSTTVKRGQTVYTVSGNSIARYYDITPTTNMGLNATLKFFYNDSELNGNTEANLNLWRSADAGVNWTNRGKTTINTMNNFISLASIDAFSRWTAAVPSILPVELLNFSGKNTEGGGNLLTWHTASEKENSHFDVERSTDGSSFRIIGQVRGNNKPSSYQYVDALPFTMSYYRLKQVDFDGTTTYSKVVSLEQKGKDKGLKVYPTLVSNGSLTVELVPNHRDTEGRQLRDFSVTNLLGQQVLVGKTTTEIDVSSLAQGTYLLKVEREVAKFVKQ